MKAAPAPAKKAAAPVKKAAAPVKVAPAPAKKAAAPAKSTATAPPAPAPAPAPGPAPARKTPPVKAPARVIAQVVARPVPRKIVPGQDIAVTKDFDHKFLEGQLALLRHERVQLTGQANRLEDEANSLIEDVEMGDVQFDDESGEGDTMVVERERDLALSAQARQIVLEIDAAIERVADGTYGYSHQSGLLIPKERLRAIPWATLRVDEKAGGIGRR